MGGFSSGKFRMDDFERALDMGACRSGDFMHFRNQRTSCCEVWNYRVKIGECKIEKNEKKAMRRFQRYLQEGPTEAQKLKEQEKKTQYLNRLYEQFIETIDAQLEKLFGGKE